MEIWETMAKKGVQYDETALNMYIAALQKSTDRKFTQEVERAKKLHKLLWKCLFGVYESDSTKTNYPSLFNKHLTPIYILYIIQQMIKQRLANLANRIIPMHIYASPAASTPTVLAQTLLDHPHPHRVVHNVVRQHRVVVEDPQRLQTHLRLRPVHQPTQPREQRRHVLLAHRLRQQLALQQQLQQQLQQRDRLRRSRPPRPPSSSCWRATC